MKAKYIITCLAAATLLGPLAVLAREDSEADRSNPEAYARDALITTKIKAKLATEHITSLGRIHVDTDDDGIVWLFGSARTQHAADQAVAIARSTEDVKDVHSEIRIVPDD